MAYALKNSIVQRKNNSQERKGINMGLWVDEKDRRKIEDGGRAVFNLLAEGSDFHEDNDEGAYQCCITLFDSEKSIIGKYYRYFLVKDFNNTHYYRFIDKFCKDINYRKQFDVINDTREHRDQSAIDEHLKNIIDELNERGVQTKYSCQGTYNAWRDRPGASDGHSVIAYIHFANAMPLELKLLLEADERLYVSLNCVSTYKRKDNLEFPEILKDILKKWGS